MPTSIINTILCSNNNSMPAQDFPRIVASNLFDSFANRWNDVIHLYSIHTKFHFIQNLEERNCKIQQPNSIGKREIEFHQDLYV